MCLGTLGVENPSKGRNYLKNSELLYTHPSRDGYS